MNLVLVIVTVLYSLLIISFCIGFALVHKQQLKKAIPKTTFSIIIPFRNEAKTIINLLTSITQLTYPKALFEVILINDDSKDNSVEIINQFALKHANLSITILNNQVLSNSPKKDAITLGVNHAKNEWIVTTDADCIVADSWLNSYDIFIATKNPVFIAAPVTYHKINSFLKRFQLLDFLSLIGTTIGSFGLNIPFMCNGANLAYKKGSFITVNGFTGNTHLASGDDIFLLEKMLKQFPKQVFYLKSVACLVTTKAEPSLTTLMAQRKRWAAKAANYNSLFAKSVGALVFCTNLLIILSLPLTLSKLIAIKTLFFCFLIKFFVDFLLLFQTSYLFKQHSFLRSYIICSFLYPIFNIYIALISQLTTYTWKDRAFKK